MRPALWGCSSRWVIVCFAAVLLWGMTGTAWGAGQFRLPKIPKLGKSQPAPEKKTAEQPTPEVTEISPASASPGSEGEVVLTGKNFNAGTGLRMSCSEEQVPISDFKVENPTRAVAHVRFPFNTQEGPCEIYVEQRPVSQTPQGEISVSRGGTVMVNQVKSVSFNISSSSAMPIALPVVYVGEGDLGFTEVMMKMQQAMQGSWGNSGKTLLLASKGQVTLKQGDKQVFTQTSSGVKEIGEMAMMGETTGVFRLVCADGKVYNFIEKADGELPKGKTVEILKRALGK